MNISFYYDIVCPYAYMASVRVDDFFEEVEWEPILLGGVFRSLGVPPVPAETWPKARQDCIEKDLLREARRHGLEICKPEGHPRRTVYAMRLILAAGERRREVSERLFRAYWQEHLHLEDKEVVRGIARELGLDPDSIDAPRVKEELRARSDAAARRGVFGVPAVFSERGLFWGADRLHLAAGRAPRPWGEATGRLRFFHDFGSPYSYLAATQIEGLAAEVEWTPILLGALFRALGTPMVPLHAFSETKQRYVRKDLEDWAAHWGVGFRFNSAFPLFTVLPLRVSILEPRATLPLYRAVWARDLDVSVPEVVREVLAEEGLDPALVEATGDPAVKQQLRSNTDLAIELGICGVPTCQVGEEFVWGQDRLWTVRELLECRGS